MTYNENTMPMISGILEAVPLPETQPTLTNIDRSTWYPLLLEKLNEKLFDDQLSVSIRLGLHPSFVSEVHPEKTQLEAWKRDHLYEQIFDVQFGGEQQNSNGNKITVNEDDPDHVYSVNADWNRNKELPLKIRFNCVSSQFRNSPVFVLVVRIASKVHKYELFHSFCQIKLTWPGLAVEQNSMNGIEDDTESQSSDQFELNIIGQTRLTPYDPIKLLRQVQYRPNDNSNERLFDYLQQSPTNFESITKESANQNLLNITFEGPEEAYIEENQDNLRSFKGIFIQPDVTFGIKIKPDPSRIDNQFEPGQVVVIRCELAKHNQLFSLKDQTDWASNNLGKTMIEPDYVASRFTSNILDVRMLSVNQIELIMTSNLESEEIAAFKVNCLSKDFAVNGQDEMPFNLTIKSIQPTTRTNLGAASFQTFTSNENSPDQMIQNWLNRNSSDLTQNILDQFNLSSQTTQMFGLVAVLFLLIFFCFPFHDSSKSNSNQSIDYSKVDQIVQAKLEIELRKFSEIVESMIQNSIDAQLRAQTEGKVDSQVLDQIIAEKFQLQFENISSGFFELQTIEKIVETKLEQFQLNITNRFVSQETATNSKLDYFDLQKSEQTIPKSSGNDSLQIILDAPTAAEILVGYPTLTNLDRSTWYNLQLNKLDQALYNEKLLVSFQIGSDFDNIQAIDEGQDLLTQWKSLHPTERLFDLEYVENDGEKLSVQSSNQIIFDNNDNLDKKLIDSASLYWINHGTANLRIRFNLAHNQFPVKRSSSTSNEVTFYLLVKVSSLNSSTIIGNAFCRVRLFWPNGATIANHKAYQLVLKSQPNANLIPSSSRTVLDFHKENLVKQRQNIFEKDEIFLSKLSIVLGIDETKIEITSNQNYLHYILDTPVMSFVNLPTLDGQTFKGFFLEQDSAFRVKLLANSKISSELIDSVVRTRFELNPTTRPFTQVELINWSASKVGPMIEVNYLQSKLPDMVHDIRQIDVNSIEMIWLPKVDQMLRDFVIAFSLNNKHQNGLALQFRVKTIMATNEGVVQALDFASSQIVLTDIGQAQISKRNWLQQNVDRNAHSSSTEISVQVLNDPILTHPDHYYPQETSSFSILVLIKFIIQWAVRIVCLRIIVAISINAYRGKFDSNTRQENIIRAGIVAIISVLIYMTFIF